MLHHLQRPVPLRPRILVRSPRQCPDFVHILPLDIIQYHNLPHAGRQLVKHLQDWEKGSNTAPACSPDGRMLAFFSTRNKAPGMYLMSLKRFKTQKLSSQHGESLRWAALPAPAAAATP